MRLKPLSEGVHEALARGAGLLQAAGVESARLDARILLAQALGISSPDLLFAETTPAQIDDFNLLVARRAAREPLAYITGRKEFWSLDFEVGRSVLIPRPETETLIEEALRRFPKVDAQLRVLDIGTGSGCLLVAMLKERPNATGFGLDISEPALVNARINASRHGLERRCRFELVNAPAMLSGLDGEFDIILANPPYLTDAEFNEAVPEIRDHEPRQAFVGGPDGYSAFRAFLPLIAHHLTRAGMAFLEIGAGQVAKVTEIVMGAGLEVRNAIPDLSGIPRCFAIGRAGVGCALAPQKNSVGKEVATR